MIATPHTSNPHIMTQSDSLMMITPDADNHVQGQLLKNMLNQNMREVGVNIQSRLITTENVSPRDGQETQYL